MSLSNSTTVTCPGCQKPGPFVLHQSVNVTLDPEAKPRLLSGELLRFTCPGCGRTVNVAHALLYHDQQKSLMIYLVPGDDAAREKFVEEMSGSPIADPATVTTRLVADFFSLKDKILAFDAGLDDRLLEVTKLVIKLQNPEFKTSRLYLEGLEGDDIALAAVGEREVQGMRVPRSGTYAWMADKLGAAGVLAQPLEPWSLVGERWAAWAIGQIKGRSS